MRPPDIRWKNELPLSSYQRSKPEDSLSEKIGVDNNVEGFMRQFYDLLGVNVGCWIQLPDFCAASGVTSAL